MGLRCSLSAVVSLLLLALLSACNAKLTVHLNCHTHDDVGWLKTVDQYYVGLNKTIDSSVVQYILHTVIDELQANPQRKFMYVEQAFFQRFWQQQTDARKADIQQLVKNKQLEFVNGGWCMHDEATTHYVDMIDQTTLGHRFIVSEFGAEANPTIGWQIDPFGHSATQASLLSAAAGFQAFFTARIDHADFDQRYATNATEWLWQASPSQPGMTVFGGIFQWANRQLYGPPSIFNYELYSNSPPVQDDPRLTDYNVDQLVETFVRTANEQAAHNLGEQLLWNLGFDFNWEAAHEPSSFSTVGVSVRDRRTYLEVLTGTPPPAPPATIAHGPPMFPPLAPSAPPPPSTSTTPSTPIPGRLRLRRPLEDVADRTNAGYSADDDGAMQSRPLKKTRRPGAVRDENSAPALVLAPDAGKEEKPYEEEDEQPQPSQSNARQPSRGNPSSQPQQHRGGGGGAGNQRDQPQFNGRSTSSPAQRGGGGGAFPSTQRGPSNEHRGGGSRDYPPFNQPSDHHSSSSFNSSASSSSSRRDTVPATAPFKAYVGNLSYKAQLRDLEDFFRCPLDATFVQHDGQFKGVCWVVFDTREDLLAALDMGVADDRCAALIEDATRLRALTVRYFNEGWAPKTLTAVLKADFGISVDRWTEVYSVYQKYLKPVAKSIPHLIHPGLLTCAAGGGRGKGVAFNPLVMRAQVERLVREADYRLGNGRRGGASLCRRGAGDRVYNAIDAVFKGNDALDDKQRKVLRGFVRMLSQPSDKRVQKGTYKRYREELLVISEQLDAAKPPEKKWPPPFDPERDAVRVYPETKLACYAERSQQLYSCKPCKEAGLKVCQTTSLQAVRQHWDYRHAQGDFFTSRPALKRYVRAASAQLQVLRQLEIWLDRDSTATELLWQNVAVAQHHDGVSGTSKQHVAFDYAQRIAKGINIAEAELYPPFAAAVTQSGGAVPTFSSCPLANVSICPTSQSSSPFTVLLYNPLAHPRQERVSLPVTTTQLQVVDSTGAAIPSDILPVLLTPALEDGAAPYTLNFLAQVPAVGFNTYHVTKAAAEKRRVVKEVKAAVAAPQPYQCGQGAGFNVSNGAVTLTFNAACVLQTYTGTNGQAIPLAHHVGYYWGYQSSTPNVTLDCNGVNSGAYLFRPQTQDKVLLPPVNASVVVGSGVVWEVRVTYGPWLSETIRLVKNSTAVEVEFTVGPIPIDDGRGKEIVVTYETLSSEATPVIFTDSNGREMQKRVKDFRPTWNLTTSYEPVSQNYFPLNALATVTSSHGGMLSLVTDRSQGVASLQVGEMEVMVHRRLFCDDNKGVGEPLNETSNISHDNPGVPYGKPLVITGVHRLQFSPSMAPARELQNRVYSPLHPLLSPLTTTVAQYTATHTTSASAVTSLSPLVEMSHLHRWNGTIPGQGWTADTNTALVRFAHLYGVGEGNDLAKPVTFDLATLFNPNVTQLKRAVQVSLTANQLASNIKPWQWQVQGVEGGLPAEQEEQVAQNTTAVTIQPMEVQTWIVQYGDAQASEERAVEDVVA